MYGYFVFFQAEDGIRDAQESRGLGDVYKRQLWCGDFFKLNASELPRIGALYDRAALVAMPPIMPVSYTHLTLPTIYSV